jgi:hypothetical protein
VDNVDNSEVIFQGSTRASDNNRKQARNSSHRDRESSKKTSSRGTTEEQTPKVVTNIITNNNYNNFIINNPKIEVTTAVPIVGLNSAPSASSSHQNNQIPTGLGGPGQKRGNGTQQYQSMTQ